MVKFAHAGCKGVSLSLIEGVISSIYGLFGASVTGPSGCYCARSVGITHGSLHKVCKYRVGRIAGVLPRGVGQRCPFTGLHRRRIIFQQLTAQGAVKK
jgi:hypothetical protein